VSLSDTYLTDVPELILTARQTVAQGVNSTLVLLYWQIGQRIRTDMLKKKRTEYGDQIVHARRPAPWTPVATAALGG
jgi:DUF1016 N-terminal domain